MQDLLVQIRAASNAGLYYAALFTALALPDICGALESADGLATGARYQAWFDCHVAPKYSGFLSGADCYLFRCSLLHQGRTQHPRGTYSRILFVEPGVSGMILHNNILNDALNIDVRIFCEDLVAAVESWLPMARTLPQFIANLSHFVTRHANGLPPYIVGVPVVA
jgi:hypothetical protein